MSLLDLDFILKAYILVWLLFISFNLFISFYEYLSDKKRYKNLKFTLYVSLIFILGAIFNYFVLSLNLKQNLVYVGIFFITLIFIKLVKSIKNKCEVHNKITEFEFFYFIFGFIVILVGYIVIFSFIYFQNIPLHDNGYFHQNNVIKVLDMKEAILFSGFTFFSMEYADLTPEGLLRWFTLLEVGIAEMIIILFIGIVAGMLFEKLKLKEQYE